MGRGTHKRKGTVTTKRIPQLGPTGWRRGQSKEYLPSPLNALTHSSPRSSAHNVAFRLPHMPPSGSTQLRTRKATTFLFKCCHGPRPQQGWASRIVDSNSEPHGVGPALGPIGGASSWFRLWPSHGSRPQPRSEGVEAGPGLNVRGPADNAGTSSSGEARWTTARRPAQDVVHVRPRQTHSSWSDGGFGGVPNPQPRGRCSIPPSSPLRHRGQPARAPHFPVTRSPSAEVTSRLSPTPPSVPRNPCESSAGLFSISDNLRIPNPDRSISSSDGLDSSCSESPI